MSHYVKGGIKNLDVHPALQPYDFTKGKAIFMKEWEPKSGDLFFTGQIRTIVCAYYIEVCKYSYKRTALELNNTGIIKTKQDKDWYPQTVKRQYAKRLKKEASNDVTSRLCMINGKEVNEHYPDRDWDWWEYSVLMSFGYDDKWVNIPPSYYGRGQLYNQGKHLWITDGTTEYPYLMMANSE